MSPSWTDARAALLPGRAVLARSGSAPASAQAGNGWEGALAALEGLLDERRPTGGIHLSLSHHFVRLFLVDPPPTWLRHGEMLAWLRERLADTLEDVGGWRLVWPDLPPGRAVPVCAMPTENLDGLEVLLARRRLRPRNIRPWLDVKWSRRRRQLGRVTGWYALLEPGIVTLLHLARGRITRLRQRLMGEEGAAALAALLQREALLAGMTPQGELWLEGVGMALERAQLMPAWQVHELQGPSEPALALLG